MPSNIPVGVFDKLEYLRFYEKYPNGEIEEFYSDMYCDTPLARLAKKAVMVKGEKLSPWKKFK